MIPPDSRSAAMHDGSNGRSVSELQTHGVKGSMTPITSGGFFVFNYMHVTRLVND